MVVQLSILRAPTCFLDQFKSSCTGVEFPVRKSAVHLSCMRSSQFAIRFTSSSLNILPLPHKNFANILHPFLSITKLFIQTPITVSRECFAAILGNSNIPSAFKMTKGQAQIIWNAENNAKLLHLILTVHNFSVDYESVAKGFGTVDLKSHVFLLLTT